MKIITSNASSGAYMGVIDELKGRLSEKNVIIAPDRFTASVERGVIISLSEVGDKTVDVTFNVEVTSFTRLANKLIGRQISKCLTPEGSVMLIRKVINDCADELTFYGKVAKKEGFENELYAALTAIRNSGIEPDAILSKARPSTALARKAHDVALIYRGYLEALGESYSDSSTRLMALAKYIEEHPESVAVTNFYCSDIYEFSSYELDILRGLARHALSLTVGIVTGEGNPNRRIYPDYMISKLRALTPDKTEVVYRRFDLHPAISALSERLFGYTDGPLADNSDGKVTVRRARNRQDEVLSLALDVMRAVREGGRYSDFEVFVSDLEGYAADIRSVFTRYSIPYHMDKKELLSEQTKARYLTLALDAVKTRMRRREVLDFVKNPLFCSEREDDVFKFENYVLKYNVDRSRFLSEFTLKADFKYAKRRDKVIDRAKEEENAVPESVRRDLVRALRPLAELCAEEHPVKEFIDAARAFLSAVDEKWQAHINKLAAFSNYYIKCAEQVDRKLESVLDEMQGALKTDISLEDFSSYLKAMLKTLRISLVPPLLDCVFFGDADSRYMGEHHVYVLGATNGALPRSASGGAVITLQDEAELSSLGLEITPDARRKAFIDRYAILDIMKKPRGRLVVSYPENGDKPSSVVSELVRMLSKKGNADEPIEEEYVSYDAFGQGDDALRLSSEGSRFYEVLKNSSADFGRGETDMNDLNAQNSSALAVAYEKLSDDKKDKVDALGEDVPSRIQLSRPFSSTTSVSRLETFFSCPYKHYFKYVVGLKKRELADFEGTENGTILHGVLEKFFKVIRDGKVDDDTDVSALADAFFDDTVREEDFGRLYENPEAARVLVRLKREAEDVCRDLYGISKRSRFKPKYLELKIGEEGSLPLYLDDEGKIRLEGKIDRVDVCDDKFVVIDYKTYKSADLTLKELYYGQKLQLFLYMRSVYGSFGLKPAGVFYLPIFAGFSDEQTNRYKFKGNVVNDPEVWKDLDSLAETSLADAVIPYKKKRGGTPNPDCMIEERQFFELSDYALRLARAGAEQIADGYVKPSPISDDCKNCDYYDVCRARGASQRAQADVDIATFDGIFGKKEENDCDF